MALSLTTTDSQTRQAWTPEEDAALFRHLLPICKEHIWTLAKNDPILSGRGGSMVKQRVNTIVSGLRHYVPTE